MLKYLHLKCIYQTTGKENLQIYMSGKAGSTADWGAPQIHVQYMTKSTTSNKRFHTSLFIFPLGLKIGKYEECKDQRMLSTLYDAGRGQQLFLPPHPPPESFTTPKMWNNDNYLLSFFMSFCLKVSMKIVSFDMSLV